MSGLYSQLFVGSNAILAQRSGISAAGQNIANVNTPGHNRLDANLRSGTAGLLGVTANGFLSSADIVLSHRERIADAELGRAQDLANATVALEGELASENGSLVNAIAALFGGITELSSNPTDIALREAALSDAQELGREMNRAARSILASQESADDRVQTLADQATQLASEIARANQELLKGDDPALSDRRMQAARELSELVGGDATFDSRGNMRFALESGAVLVDGARASRLETTRDAVAYGGRLRVDVVNGNLRRDVTQTISSGRIGAQLDFRDRVSSDMMQAIDQLAYDLATEMNAVHRSNADVNGQTGRNLFTSPNGVQGAALTFSVDPSIVEDPARLAGATPGLGAGNNSGLLALADLQEAMVAGNGTGTFIDEGLRMMTSLGFDVQRVEQDREIAQRRADSLASFRDSVSGVSVEEELTKLQAYQRATEATAQVVSTVDGLLGMLIETL